MTKTELKAALETTIATHRGASISETSDGYMVSVDCNGSVSADDARVAIIRIRNSAMELLRSQGADVSQVRYAKQIKISGFWHMGRFHVTSAWRVFSLAA